MKAVFIFVFPLLVASCISCGDQLPREDMTKWDTINNYDLELPMTYDKTIMWTQIILMAKQNKTTLTDSTSTSTDFQIR